MSTLLNVASNTILFDNLMEEKLILIVVCKLLLLKTLAAMKHIEDLRAARRSIHCVCVFLLENTSFYLFLNCPPPPPLSPSTFISLSGTESQYKG